MPKTNSRFLLYDTRFTIEDIFGVGHGVVRRTDALGCMTDLRRSALLRRQGRQHDELSRRLKPRLGRWKGVIFVLGFHRHRIEPANKHMNCAEYVAHPPSLYSKEKKVVL